MVAGDAGAGADAALMVVVRGKTVSKKKMKVKKKEKKNTYQAFITVRRPLVVVVYDCRHSPCKSSL
jgi:hypothetical protein